MPTIKSMLTLEEGFRNKAYPDPLTGGAPWTCGIGCTGPDIGPNTVWTDDEVNRRYAEREAKAINDCVTHFDWWADLDEVRQAVVVGMVYQMGIGHPASPVNKATGVMGFPKFLQAMEDRKWNQAAGEMRDSLWARQTPKRAARAARAIETGEWQWT